MTGKFYIETFGCQMNKGDSELMQTSLKGSGFSEADSINEADICIFNTCSVRDHAEKRALARIEEAKRSKARPGRLVVVAGCMAQRIGHDILSRGIADLAIGPYQSPLAGKIISNYLSNKGQKEFISQDSEDFAERLRDDLIQNKDSHPWHKFVTITHGCENFCSYCIVPYVRGKLISFPSDRIVRFIKDLAAEGFTEITLLGQNVNQYGQDSGDIPFYSLLEKTASVEGLIKVNFLTSHPMDFSGDIVRVIKDNPVISRSIHLPLQSGSDRMLKMMNRQYTMSHYNNAIDTIKKELPDYALSTDLIVGFPGETEEDFHETLDAVKKIENDDAVMYGYSPREGRPSFTMEEELTRDQKIGRLNELISIQRKISLEKLKSRINKKEKAIADKISRRSDSEVSGKTHLDHPVVFEGDKEDIGRQIEIEITEVRGSTLVGRKVHNSHISADSAD